MVVPAMTLEKALVTDRTNDSIVGLVVWYNILQIRQRLIDEYWWDRLRLLDLKSNKKRPPLNQLTALQKRQFLHEVAPLVHNEYSQHPELGILIFSPEELDPLPISLQTKKEFAQNSGISEGRYTELEALHQIPNVEELVAIARIGDVDISYMFMPTMDILESDDTLILNTINGIPLEITASRWVLWVRSLMHLPGQSGKKFLTETAIPSIRREGVDGNPKRTTAKVLAEITKRTHSSVGAMEAIKEDFQSLTVLMTLDPTVVNPFQITATGVGYSKRRGKFISTSVNKLLAHQRKLISMSRVESTSSITLFKRFTKGAVEVHVLLNVLVNKIKNIEFKD